MTDWSTATAECIRFLQDLIRIPSVNPAGVPEYAAGRDTTGGETAAARYCTEVLTSAGIDAEVIESAPGRGSCVARLRATVPEPLPPIVLLGHLDVVPVEAERWSRDPFGGELVDGVVWGRGAVDMKNMVAMELAVMVALRRAWVELRRDVIFAALADEEAGGHYGALHMVARQPEIFRSDAGPAAAALNEVGGYSITIDGRRYYTLQVAEKGIVWTRLRAEGTPGHGSMPAGDNAAVAIANAVSAIAATSRPTRVVPVVGEFLEATGLADAVRNDRLAEADLDPVTYRSIDAMVRDTVSPNVIRAGTKMNVLPGRAEAEVDVRTLPGTDQEALLAELQSLVGRSVSVEAVMTMPAVEWASDAEIVTLMREALLAADPDSTPVPMMITPGTDAKALAKLGIPTYGFAPLRLDPSMPFLSLFHGHDERVPVSAVAFGLPVLYDVVHRFATR